MLAIVALYLTTGLWLVYLSRKELAQQAMEVAQELHDEGLRVPPLIALLVLYLLGVAGWPVFVIVTQSKRG